MLIEDVYQACVPYNNIVSNMARTWRKGHFGLSVLSGINRAFNTIDASFDNNLTANFTDLNTIPVENVEVDDVQVLIYTPVAVQIPTYGTNITYSAINTTNVVIDKPTYKDIGVIV